jgi:hypothetical protein
MALDPASASLDVVDETLPKVGGIVEVAAENIVICGLTRNARISTNPRSRQPHYVF